MTVILNNWFDRIDSYSNFLDRISTCTGAEIAEEEEEEEEEEGTSVIN